MKITVESSIDAEYADAFYRVYVAAFGPMQTRAAARHLLTAAEFAEEMADKRIDKYVVWNDVDEPIALTTFTNDLTAVPWISAEFYAARYPAEFARRAVFYLGYTLVNPDRGTPRAFPAVMRRLVERMQEAKGVCVFDVCAYNDDRAVGRMWNQVRRSGAARVGPVDVQTYYAASFVDSDSSPEFDTRRENDTVKQGVPA
jgi:hypothetical protein